MENIVKFLSSNWDLIIIILFSIYELAVRVKPTLKSHSILNFLAIVLDRSVPNKVAGGGQFVLNNDKTDQRND